MADAQVAIIGGGAMGVSLAYHLTKLGWSDVVLLEKNDLTHGSTWHAAGLCTHFAHNPTIQELRARSVRLYRNILPEETGMATGFHATGAMRVTRNPDRMDEFAHVAGLSRFTGYDLRLITPDEIAELHPLAALDGLIGGIYEPDDGHVDPTSAVNAMAHAARGRGLEIRRYCPVTGIRREGDWIIETPQGPLSAKHIVNAAGTWGFEIGEMMGINVPSVPVLHQYLVTDRIEAVAAQSCELPIIRDPEESWYVRQERDGLILGPYETDANVWSPDRVPPEFGADLMPADLDRIEHIVEAAMARVPALADGGIKTVINGPITFSPDANPLIGPAFGAENAWLMTGSSMGVMEGGGAGWFLAHWMTHDAPPMDPLAIDPRRFGQWADRDFRIAKAVECFGLQFGVHYPFEERPAARCKRLTPLYDRQASAGATFGAAFGWERPNYYGAPAPLTFARPGWFECAAAEVAAVTTGAGITDLSALSKFELQGPDIEVFIDQIGTNIPPGMRRVGLTYALNAAGGVEAEFSVLRTGNESAWLISAAAAEERDADLLRVRSHGRNLNIYNRTEQTGIVAIMGPDARDLLQNLGAGDLGNGVFPWLTTAPLTVAGIATQATRVSYVGELGWELMAPMADLPALWDAITGQGATPFGAYAMNSMRLEKGYRAWGLDLTSERTPGEAGLSRFCRTEGREFIGRDAMVARDGDDPWRMVLLDIDAGATDPFYGHTIMHNLEPVGVITSAAFGHRTARSLGLAYLRPGAPDQGLSVKILGKEGAAQVLPAPPFDPSNRRLKG